MKHRKAIAQQGLHIQHETATLSVFIRANLSGTCSTFGAGCGTLAGDEGHSLRLLVL